MRSLSVAWLWPIAMEARRKVEIFEEELEVIRGMLKIRLGKRCSWLVYLVGVVICYGSLKIKYLYSRCCTAVKCVGFVIIIL